MEIPVIMFVLISILTMYGGYQKGYQDCLTGEAWYK
jgi:hypothetical protein